MSYLSSRSIRSFLKWLAAALCLFSFLHMSKKNSPYSEFSMDSDDIDIPHGCACADDDGVPYNFCYRLPENKSAIGKKFDCKHLNTMQRLGLLNREEFLDLSIDPLPTPVFVTAFSENHASEAKRLQYLIRKFFPEQKLIIYDLGLDASKDHFASSCLTEVRTFDFSKYPDRVKLLGEYRWKPIVIAETLQEFGAIWYMDSSITFKKGDLNHVYDLVRCRATVNDRPPLLSIPERDEREKVTEHESGWDQVQWAENVKECRKGGYLFHGFTGHGIYPATSLSVYNYIPTNMEEIKKPKAKMYEAGFVFVARTDDAVSRILKWYVLCALEDGCMGGDRTTTLGCSFPSTERFSEYANCHRFDQSIVNLLAANAFYYDRHYYVSEIVDFFNVVRGGSVGPDEQQCAHDCKCT